MVKEVNFLKKYDYSYPKNLIANKPATPRDSARLLIYNRREKTVNYNYFKNLSIYLPQKTVLVFNKTKVIPARLEALKETGGRVKLLYLGQSEGKIRFLANRKLINGSKIFLKNKKYWLSVDSSKNGEYFLIPAFKIKLFTKILEKLGEAPLPPYIKNSSLSKAELKKRYQTIFAEKSGSVAAPTASLHFTKRLLNDLQKNGVKTKFLTLHVGQGTFAPLSSANLKSAKLHQEFFEIDMKTVESLNNFKKDGWKIIPVGTTSLRALETSANKNRKLKKLSGFTDIFIKEEYKFKFVDGLITNFHVPKSSLIMLVSALIGRREVIRIYKLAIKRKFRLFSFGDGMLIL